MTTLFEFHAPFMEITDAELRAFDLEYYPKHKKVLRYGQAFVNYFGIESFPELFYEEKTGAAKAFIREYVRQYFERKASGQIPTDFGYKSPGNAKEVGGNGNSEPTGKRNVTKKRKRLIAGSSKKPGVVNA